MPRPTRVTLAPTATDANGISLSQTPAAGGVQSLTITGALASGGSVTFSTPQHVTITSAGVDTARTFTVTGTDRDGLAMTEDITGPSTSVTLGIKNFATVTGITVDDDTAGAITAGVDGLCESRWFSLDHYTNEFNVGFGVDVTGTITFTVQHTYDDIFVSDFDEITATAYDHTSVAAKSADTDGSYATPITAMRVEVTASASGTAAVTIIQAG
jgi:hypothetical protein